MDSATTIVMQLRDDFSPTLLDQFIALYNDAFPDPSEREDPAQWRERLCNEMPTPQPRLFLALALTGYSANPQVVAGLAFEYYRESNCGLLTYLVVDPQWRQKGLASRLAKEALATLLQQAGARGLDGVFSEVEDPVLMSTTDGPIAPADRLRVMARLGARWIDIPYVQPELIGGDGRSRHLLLLTFPVAGVLPQASAVRAFLHEFYRALDVVDPETDVDFRKIDVALKTNFRCGCFEVPVLPFRHASFALHFVEYATPVLQERIPYPANPAFHSMELDLLAYQFQERPPFGSRNYGDGALPVTITFPTQLTFYSEGRTVALRTAQPMVQAQASLSMTHFLDSDTRVWHVVLRPAPGHIFDEYTLIKLIHLYDGRAEKTSLKRPGKVRFAFTPPESQSQKICESAAVFLQALRDVYKAGRAEVAVAAGTIQLITDGDAHEQLIGQAQAARSGQDCKEKYAAIKRWVDSDTREGLKLKAYAGIITGIFDFLEIDTEELLDTFEPTFTDSALFIRINRGSVLQMTPRDRALESVIDSIGISPYLIIPHAVLLHNEELVKRAEQQVDLALRGGRISVLESAYQGADMNLRYYHLPNIFNYPTERALFERGSISRGSHDRRTDVLEKLDELKDRLKARWLRRQDVGRIIVAGLLAVFTGLQTRDFFVKVLGMNEMAGAMLGAVVAAVLVGAVVGLGLYGVRKDK